MRKVVFLSILILVSFITATAQAAPSGQTPEGQVYTVQADDWLSKIAEKFYGDVLAYPRIVEATNAMAAEDNTFVHIDNPDRIEVGQKLWIPQPATEAASEPAATPPVATEVIHYVPQVPAESVEGNCWTSSIAAPGSAYAWRCSVGNRIYDPCLTAVDEQTIVCGVPDQEIALDLTEPLPQAELAGQPARPWQLTLQDGATCTPFTGTLPPIEEQAVYSCSDEAVIIGELQQDDPVWYARKAFIEPDEDGPLPFRVAQEELVPIQQAWLAGDPAQAGP